MKKFLSILALITAPILVAHANPSYVQNGFYVTGALGYGYLFTPNNNQNAPTTQGSYSHGGLAGNIGGGYRWAMDSFTSLGLETDYLYNGKATYHNNSTSYGNASYNGTSTVSAQGLGLLAVFFTQWENGINIFGKAGMAYIVQDQNYSSPAVVSGALVSGSQSEHGFQFIGVAGMGYLITSNINLFMEGTYISGHSGGSWTTTDNKVNNNIVQNAQLSAGLSYYF
ncbi:MAG: hypothetical protein NTV32_06050 [Gammaproteobacteria bacterium]|jgi:opacity protein-like surface antigen|nr:hypothetical protein [Gammaproteobacteria bacterium]